MISVTFTDDTVLARRLTAGQNTSCKVKLADLARPCLRRGGSKGLPSAAPLRFLCSVVLHQGCHLIERAHAFLSDVLVRNFDSPSRLCKHDEFDDAGGIQHAEFE